MPDNKKSFLSSVRIEDLDMETVEDDYKSVRFDEGNHFTCRRSIMLMFNFCVLFGTQMIWKSDVVEDWIRYTTIVIFALIEMYLTKVNSQKVQYAHIVKKA